MMKTDFNQLAAEIKRWGILLGFQQIGITDINLAHADQKLKIWLERQWHGEMEYMAAHGSKRTRPEQLIPGTLRIISARMNYLPANTQLLKVLQNKDLAYISRYALGRDYHKLMRKRLDKLAKQINQKVHNFNYRAFVDSAPVMEKPLAEKAGLGWMGKHTLILNREAGSWFFLGEIYTDIPLPLDNESTNHCGSCSACMDICPTKAIIAPYQLDARRCISYLTIEYKGSIPEEFRPLLGNRIFGCDDCQLICPWNKFAKFTDEKDFHPRHGLEASQLIDLFAWTEAEFKEKTEGSAIKRAGYECWLRNIAIALGNASSSPKIITALRNRENHDSALVREHVNWALQQHNAYFR